MSKTRNQEEAIKLLEGLISHIGSGNIEGKQLERLLYLLHYLLEDGGTLSDGRLDFITKLLENEKISFGKQLKFTTEQGEEDRYREIRDIPSENQDKTKKGVWSGFGDLLGKAKEKGSGAVNTAKEKVKDISTIKGHGSDEKNDLTGREKQRNNTVTSPTPATVPEKKSEEELIRDEIRSKIARQTNLLEETLQFCCSKESQSDVKKIISHWKNILDAGECQVLLKHFKKICDKGGDVPKIWLRFLKDHGLIPEDDTVEQIVVGTGNRGKYINGMNIPDGVCAVIIKHPWLFEGELCCKGVLEQLPESNEAEPEES